MGKRAGDYAVSKDRLLDRLVRIEGQVRGIGRMVQDDRPCIDVLTQISAVRAALDKVALGLLDRHVRTGLPPSGGSGQEDRADEVMGAVGRLLSR
jgi:DNA-binding FrmR family transcriptional regulator